MSNSAESPAAVYVAFSTFKNALDQLSQGVPNRIDRSVFPGLSGGVRGQLIAAFKFLGMIDEDGKPQSAMRAVAVPGESERKEQLKALLEERYSELFALDLLKTTPAELGDRMATAYNVSGATRDKAIRFFLSALDYVEIPVSPLFEKKRTGPRPSSGASPKKRAARKTRTPRGSGATSSQTPPPPSGHSTTVSIKSGGSITLSASIDLFSISAEDRDFVFGLIDQMRGYEQAEEVDEDDEMIEEDME